MATRKEREEFLKMLQTEVQRVPAHWVTYDAGTKATWIQNEGRKLLRHAYTHGRLAVEECNSYPDQWHRWVQSGVWTQAKLSAAIDERAKYIETRQKAAEKRIKEICAELGLQVECGGDPRGYTVKVHFPSDKYNTWGGKESGWGVPQ